MDVGVAAEPEEARLPRALALAAGGREVRAGSALEKLGGAAEELEGVAMAPLYRTRARRAYATFAGEFVLRQK